MLGSMKHVVCFALFVFFVSSCTKNSNGEKYQEHSVNIIDVRNEFLE